MEMLTNSNNELEDEVALKKAKRNIYKNIILISFCFLLNFTSFQGLSRLQSSLHRDEGMGVINQSVLYGALVISCLFLPKLMIRILKHKIVIGIAFCGYVLWMGANGVGIWATMTPASIIVGIVAAPLWTAQCSYFTKLGVKYARISKSTEEAVISTFFGIFFMFFQMSSIFGSIISSTVLRQTTSENETLPTDEQLKFCGQRDCPWNQTNIQNPNLTKPSNSTVWIMVGTYIAVAICAVIIILSPLVDRLPPELDDEPKPLKEEAVGLFIVTIKQLRHKKQLLLIPITMYSGFEQGFYSAEWNKSFITCTLGIWKVGLATLPFGIVNSIFSFSSGSLVKYVGRLPFFILGFLIDLAIQIFLMIWAPHYNKEYVFFIISAFWGLTDGIWQTQINALYGVAFANESEAAFSNYRMWESLGFIIAFAYSNAICTNAKLYVLTSVLCIGMVGYFVVEYLIYKEQKTERIFPIDENEKGPTKGVELNSTNFDN